MDTQTDPPTDPQIDTQTDPQAGPPPDPAVRKARLREIVAVFLRLGILAFGGPAAHVAMMEQEVVVRRKWLSREKFLDLYGATSLIPGPNSTEMAIHLGFERGGVAGLFLAGTAFILPAMGIVLAIAVGYGRFGTLPEVDRILFGIKPVVLALILQAAWRLGKSAVKDRFSFILGLGLAGLYLLGVLEIPLLLAGGIVAMGYRNRVRLLAWLRAFRKPTLPLLVPPVLLASPAVTPDVSGPIHEAIAALGRMPLHWIFLLFLKTGSVLYGSGYVLVAFLERDFVETYGVLTSRQLLDAVAVGQVTPGPVFTTATFIGYLLGDVPGAVLATVGIFLPAFLLVLLVNPLIPRMRRSPWFSGLLDGVTLASLVLMALVGVRLGIASLTDWVAITLFAASLVLMLRTKVDPGLLILAGGLLGWLSGFL